MKHPRSITAALACAGLLAAGGGLAPAVAAPTAPTYSASIAVSGDCTVTVVADWAKARVAEVFNVITMPNTATITMEAGSRFSSAGSTFERQRATFVAGPFVTSDTSYPWSARVDFYSSRGALLDQQWTATASAPCTTAAPS